MIISKKLLIGAAAVTVLAGGYGVAKVSAASDPANPQASLVQKIADTFHLDPAKVQAVFDQNRSDRQAAAETRYEQMLSQGVTDGKLTASQKSAILDEHNKLKSEMDAAASKSGTDRRTAMQSIRTEAETWAKDNNVSAHWLMGARPMRGMGPGMGRHMGGDMGDPGATPAPSTTPTPSS